MKNCEHYEALVSCWLDRELDREGQVEMLDHFVRCSTCRNFYRESRVLDGLVAGLNESAEPPAAELWKGIEKSSYRPRSNTYAWMGWAATIAVIAIGLGVAVSTGNVAPPLDRVVELQLGEDSGQMSDERFISLTTEMLRADERYRSAMLQILDKVERESGSAEQKGEDAFQLAETEEGTTTPRGSRLPA